MKVFLLKDVEAVGMHGTMVNVTDGYATNFLFPKKYAVAVTPENEHGFKNMLRNVETKKEVVASKTSMLAEHIKSLKVTMRRKTHEKKLYGSISQSEIADALAEQGVKVAKNQIVFDKSIKEVGSYEITVKLTSKLQPTFQLKIVAE